MSGYLSCGTFPTIGFAPAFKISLDDNNDFFKKTFSAITNLTCLTESKL